MRQARRRFCFAFLLFSFVDPSSARAQAAPCCGQTQPSTSSSPSGYYTPPNPTPQNTYQPGTFTNTGVYVPMPTNPLTQPNPNTPPSVDQTRWYVNNHPDLRTLDPGIKDAIIHGGAGSGLLNSPYLPNGRPNPFSQNGQQISNWYLPTTWTSHSMSWSGVQSNGFLPLPSTSYNPVTHSSIPSYSSPTNYYRSPVYTTRPPIQQTSSFLSTSNQNRAISLSIFQSSLPSLTPTSSRAPATSLLATLARSEVNTQRSLSLSEASSDKVAQITNHAAWARAFIQQGSFEQALLQLSVAEPMSRTLGDPRLQANLLQTRSAAYLLAGQYEKSIEANKQALNVLQPVGAATTEADIYSSLGWAYQSLGDFPEAIRQYQQADSLYGDTGNKEGKVRTQMGLASLYVSMGEFQKASERYQDVVSDMNRDQYTRTLISMAEVHLALHAPTQALRRYDMAFELSKPLHDMTLLGAIETGRGRAEMALKSYALAGAHFNGARAFMQDARDPLGEAGVITSQGELNYWLALDRPWDSPANHLKAALEDYNEALPMLQKGGDRLGEIGLLTDSGLVYDLWGKPKDAIRYYLQALDKLEQLQTSARIEEFRVDIATQASNLYQRAVELEIEQHNYVEAFALSERARARAFLDQLGNSKIDLLNVGGHEFSVIESDLRRENIFIERQLHQELAKPAPEVNHERMEKLEAQLDSVRKRYDAALGQLRIDNPQYASFLSISPLSLRAAQEQIPSDTTALSYFFTQGAIYVFVLTRNDFRVARLSTTRNHIEEGIGAFRDFPSDGDSTDILKALYKALISPVQSKIKTARLAVIPYGSLHELPFGALTRDGKTFLADKYELFYLPTVSALPYIGSYKKPFGNHTLVVAKDREPGLAPLTYADEEANAVASLLGTTPLLGDSATVSAVRSAAGKNDILHLIAHIDINKKHPQFSGILLADSDNSDGVLKLTDIYGLNLSETNLVVLSGCESHMGSRTRGDDISSLTRGFIYAGAPSVVASLWSVDDAATEQLMVAFYTNLKQGKSKADSLRAAQAQLRQHYVSPYYWAGFVLTGDPGTSSISH